MKMKIFTKISIKSRGFCDFMLNSTNILYIMDRSIYVNHLRNNILIGERYENIEFKIR